MPHIKSLMPATFKPPPLYHHAFLSDGIGWPLLLGFVQSAFCVWNGLPRLSWERIVFFCSIVWKQLTCHCHFPLCLAVYSNIFPVQFVLIASRPYSFTSTVSLSALCSRDNALRRQLPLFLIHGTQRPVKCAAPSATPITHRLSFVSFSVMLP